MKANFILCGKSITQSPKALTRFAKKHILDLLVIPVDLYPMALDRVQKHLPLSNEAVAILRKAGLVEGRKNNLIIAKCVAQKVGKDAVDVGVVEHRKMVDGKSEYKQYKVDFIATDGNEKDYIQSAYEIETGEKREQELNSLKRIDDSFQIIVIVKDSIMPYRDNKGIQFTGLSHFLSSDKPA